MSEERKKKILIIEDNADIIELYRIYFEQAGFQVLIGVDGLQGIVALLDQKPDIILLDIMMPQMNGFEVLEAIKFQSSIETPIVVCSNLSQESDKQKALEMGVKAYITKSDYEVPEIVKKTQEILIESTPEA